MREDEPRRRRDFASILLLAFFALKLSIVLVAVDRGFEMGDEGYFLLNLNHPEAALPPLEIYRVLGALCPGCEIGVVDARLLRIAVELVGSFALVGGVFVWARARVFAPGAVRFVAFLPWCLLGALLSVASRSLGYNDMTNLVSYAAVGALFHLASLPADAVRRRASAAVLVGALTGAQLAVKFPPALLLAAVVTLVLTRGLHALSVRERLSLVAAFAAGGALVVALVVWGTGGAQAMVERLAVASRLPALAGYDPSALLARYALAEVLTVFHGAVFLLVFAAVRHRALNRDPANRDRALARALGVAAAVLLAGAALLHPHFLPGSLVALTCLTTGIPLLLFAAFVREQRTGGLLLVLLVLPLVLVAGTNVPITLRLPTHILPLFVLLAVLVLHRRGRAGAGRFEATLVVLWLAVTGSIFVRHHLLSPYGLPRPIGEQRLEMPNLPGVRVDLATRTFLNEVSTSLSEAGFRRGDPVIAFDYTPGLVFFLGGTSPRYNLYMFDLPAYNCFNVNRAELRTTPFVILAQPMSPAQRDCLETIRFPDAYRLIRTLPFPYQEVYAGFDAPGFSHVYLYAPRDTAPDRGP